jgi:hypothetical protein
MVAVLIVSKCDLAGSSVSAAKQLRQKAVALVLESNNMTSPSANINLNNANDNNQSTFYLTIVLLWLT